jgi:hypothetical protein
MVTKTIKGMELHPDVEAQLDAIPVRFVGPLSGGSKARKDVPLFSGVMAYFPDALVEVARLSKAGNDKHNPGQPLHWAREKSMDHADCIARHLLEYDQADPEDGILHATKVAWRALALLQEEMERRGAPMSRGSR